MLHSLGNMRLVFNRHLSYLTQEAIYSSFEKILNNITAKRNQQQRQHGINSREDVILMRDMIYG